MGAIVQAILIAAAIAAILGFLAGTARRLWIMWRRHRHHRRVEQEKAIKEIVRQVLDETKLSKP